MLHFSFLILKIYEQIALKTISHTFLPHACPIQHPCQVPIPLPAFGSTSTNLCEELDISG